MNLKQLPTSQIPGQSKSSARPFPTVYTPHPNVHTNFIYLQQFFKNNNKQILQEVSKQGALFFRNFNIRSPNQLSSVLNKLGLQSFQYIGGAAVRKLIIGSSTTQYKTHSTQIFTTNESPPNQPIPFHNQLLQNPNYPQYIVFYCYRQADTGGSTPLVSGQQLYKYILQKYPQFVQKLQKLGVRYMRVVGKQDNPASPIGRGWKNIFKVDSKQQGQIKMKQKGYTAQWIQNSAQQDCRLISSKLPAITTSKSGHKVFCNQMIAVFKGWIDAKNSPDKCLKFGDFSDVPIDILQDISKYADSIKASIEWKVGDFVIIDNEMVMHSREVFTGVNRKVYAGLLKGTKQIKQELNLVLNSGDCMPIVGFGTWKLDNKLCQQVVFNAIKYGYKLIDCAGTYGNQEQVGRGINKALNQKLIARQNLFVTSKIWNTFHRPEHVKEACKRTLKDLGLEYLDLYLMHYPLALKYVDPSVAYPTSFENQPFSENGIEILLDDVPIIDTWRAMEELVKEGLVRNIGVSNFNVSLLRDLYNSASIKPTVNQVQIHPYLTQKKLIRYCQENGIQITSYSTMGGASYVQMGVSTKQQLIVQTDVVKKLSQKYKKTAPQIIFRWAVQQGLAIIPKTSKVERLEQNSNVSGWRLEEEDMKLIDGLNRDKRYCDPVNFFGEDLSVDLACWN